MIFLVNSTGPLGCLLYMLEHTPAHLDKIRCIKPLNEVAELFHTKLKSAVIRFRKELPLDAIIYILVYSV